MEHAARSAIFSRAREIRSGAMERGIAETKRVAAVRLFSVWRRSTRLCRGGIRDDGSNFAAGHNGAALSDDAGGETESEVVTFGHLAAEARDSDGAATNIRTLTGSVKLLKAIAIK